MSPIATSTIWKAGPLPDRPLKLFFDECVGEPAIQRIRLVFQPLSDRYQFDSIFDQRWKGELDKDWLPLFKPEDGVVITADKGRGKRGDKLPILCFQLGITHVRLTSTVHHMRAAEKTPFLIAAIREWHVFDFPEPGRCYSLSIQENGRPKLTDRTDQARKRYTGGE